MAQITGGIHLFVGFGTADDAGVIKTVRTWDGLWKDPLEPILDTGAGFAVPAVAAATWPPWEQHILVVNGGTPVHAMETWSDPRTPFGNVETQAGHVGDVVAIAADGLRAFDQLHVCAVTNDFRLWHTVRRPTGSWTPFGDVAGQAGNPGSGAFIDVDCADVAARNMLHICAVTSEGRLWHAGRHGDDIWLPFQNVEIQAGERGTFERVACTVREKDWSLHLVGLTEDRRLWHTVRDAVSGNWTQFKPLPPVPGFDPVNNIACRADNFNLLVCAVRSGPIFHTILGGFSAWIPWRNLDPELLQGVIPLGARHVALA